MKRLTLLFWFCSVLSFAQVDTVSNDELFDLSLEQLLNLELVDDNFYLFGYINSNLQKTFDYPTYGEGNSVKKESDPVEWSPIKNFHIYGKGNLTSRISYLFNLAGNEDFLEIRNAYGNFAVSEAFQVRVGKMYRKFGLYNERLDQIPTFIGIEPPEMLDSDHLFLMRTTNFMLHGVFSKPTHEISYALMTDNGENGPLKKLFPLGVDVRLKSHKKSFIVGFSGYTSSIANTRTSSTVGLMEGPPSGGILPWMSSDRFVVAGIFLEKQLGNFLIQSEYYNSKHSAERDTDATLQIVKEADINSFQRARFLGQNATKENALLTADDVIRKADYNTQTFYVRVAYNVKSSAGQFVPYLFFDWMSQPESIRNKLYGGDDEAGLSENGKFVKPSAGVVFRPVPTVAIKLDGSYHLQKFNGENVMYPELRLDFSFAFSNSQLDKALKN